MGGSSKGIKCTRMLLGVGEVKDEVVGTGAR